MLVSSNIPAKRPSSSKHHKMPNKLNDVAVHSRCYYYHQYRLVVCVVSPFVLQYRARKCILHLCTYDTVPDTASALTTTVIDVLAAIH